MTAPDQPPPRPPETADQTLRRLMAEGGWSNRTLSAATAKVGRKLGHSSIGNIARGPEKGDRASVEALSLLATAMGHPPEVFLDVRLHRVRRLFDARDPQEGGIGPNAAAENYQAMVAIFPHATQVTLLSDGAVAPPAAALLEHALREEAQRGAQDASAGEASPPPAAEPPPAQAKRSRRRRQA